MEVLDAVDVVGGIHSKGNAIQTPMADHAGEALGMIGLPSSPQNALHYGVITYVAGLQSVDIAGFTVSLLLHGIKGLPS